MSGTPAPAPTPGNSVWTGVVTATIIFALALAASAWLAIPRADLCVAILPAPPGCRIVDRVPTAVAWASVVAVGWAAVAVSMLRVGRRSLGVVIAFNAALLAVAALGYRAVLYVA
jgi:hypothetical protein